jgi:hypothetical protein
MIATRPVDFHKVVGRWCSARNFRAACTPHFSPPQEYCDTVAFLANAHASYITAASSGSTAV